MFTEESTGEQIHVIVTESSQVGEARRRVSALAIQAGLEETRVGVCALIAVQLNTTVSDFIRACDKLLIVQRPALTTEELDILDGYITELIERFLSSPKLV